MKPAHVRPGWDEPRCARAPLAFPSLVGATTSAVLRPETVTARSVCSCPPTSSLACSCAAPIGRPAGTKCSPAVHTEVPENIRIVAVDPNPGYAVRGLLYASRMRTVRGGVSFAGVIAAAATGAYLGAAIAGLLALLTGQVFAAGSPWPAGVSVLALLGAVGGWLLARLTRLALMVNRRTLVFTVAGLISFPLAVAIGQLRQVGSIGIGLVMIAGLTGVVTHVSSRRRRAMRRPSGRYARALR